VLTSQELRAHEFDARQKVWALRRAVFDGGALDRIPELSAAETELQGLSDERAAVETREGVDDGRIVSAAPASRLLGPDTTGIDAKVELRMTSVPTSLVHLFNASDRPLVSYELTNTVNNTTKRLRLVAMVEGYSARAVDTVELKGLVPTKLTQLPTFFPDRMSIVNELTRATVNVKIQDLDAKTELHKTIPVWLLARTTAPLQVKDPASGKWQDLTPYLGAYVTPNAPAIMSYLRTAADKQTEKRLVGYQVGEPEVVSQVKAVYEALAASGIVYVNSTIDFTPERGSANQRVRLPREALQDREANCIDGTLLMASLLEAISLNPAIVIIPGHAFLAWETWLNSGTWRYVETTMMSTDTFEAACQVAEDTAAKWIAAAGDKDFKRRSLRDLRAQGITPLE
jgi:hypothetical protein